MASPHSVNIMRKHDTERYTIEDAAIFKTLSRVSFLAHAMETLDIRAHLSTGEQMSIEGRVKHGFYCDEMPGKRHKRVNQELSGHAN